MKFEYDKPPHICQGLWEKMTTSEKYFQIEEFRKSFKNGNIQERNKLLNDSVNELLVSSDESLSHVLRDGPERAKLLIKKLESALEKKLPDFPEEVYLTQLPYGAFSLYIGFGEIVQSDFKKYVSEERMNDIFRERLSKILDKDETRL